MTKADLMNLVGKYVFVEFKSGRIICGILHFADEFSENMVTERRITSM